MQMRYFFGALALLSGLSTFASRPTHIIEVPAETREDRSKIANLGYAIEEVFSDKVYLYGTAKDAAKLKANGLQAKADRMQDRWFQIDESLQERFTSYPEVLKRLEKIQEDYPDLASLDVMGKSTEGRDLVYVRISGQNKADAEINGTPQMVYMGCHHAREYISVEVPLLFAEYLVENYETNAEVRRLVDSREIFILPVLNPDGHIYDYSDGIRGKMWRKNRRENKNGSVGVDLNRNYGYKWGTGGSSTNPSSDVFMGPTPFSEPETLAVKNFLSSRTRLKATLDFHSFSELVLYPWGYTYDPVGLKDGKASDLEIFETMAEQMASWNGYKPQPASDLYIASGNLFDYAYGGLGLISFTFELSPRSRFSGGFYPSPRIIPDTFQANIKPMMYMLEYADDPTRVLNEDAPDFAQSPVDFGIPVASFSDLSL